MITYGGEGLDRLLRAWKRETKFSVANLQVRLAAAMRNQFRLALVTHDSMMMRDII